MIESRLMKKLAVQELEPPVKRLSVRQIINGGFDYFDKIEDLKLAIQELDNYIHKANYHFEDEGSSRTVYNLDNKNYVLKIANGERGLTQNKAEGRLSDILSDVPIASVLTYSKKGLYLIQEKARPLDVEVFERVYNMPWEEFSEIADGFGFIGLSKKDKSDLYNSLSREAKELVLKLSKHNIIISDLSYGENWGMIGREPVIIDYGGTLNTFKKHYM